MDYRIEIKDMENLADPLVLEYAERNSISLNWMGGDDKTQPIIGSELNFSMEVLNAADGKYIQYFTSDEQKWQVTKYISDTDTIVWRGYLLPESYSEPWANPTFYPQFSAVDGLGLLKGKKLTDDFYSEEKTVIEIISACLQLTGIDFDIFLSPAIQNTRVKNWEDIYLDTRFYQDKPSAYEILEDIISSLRCQLFQCEGRWYIEGINKRNLETVSFFKYDINGNSLGTVDVQKNIKKVEWYPTPLLSMNPALKEVEITYEATRISLAEDVYKEQSIEWVKAPGVKLEILPEHWNYNESFPPVMKAPEYFLEIPSIKDPVPPEAFISLKEKIFVLKNETVKVNMDFKIIKFYRKDSTELEEDTLSVYPKYQFEVNGNIVATNVNSDDPDTLINYNSDEEGNCTFYFTPVEDGFLDIKMFTPRNNHPQFEFTAIQVQKIELDNTKKEKETTFLEKIDEKSSQVKEIDLAISDNINGLSQCFYLEKQRVYHDTEYFKVQVPILYSFPQEGNNYHVVSLKHANLIEQYINYVHYTNRYNYLDNLEVIYNLNGGEQMVVKADNLMTGYLYVTVRPFREPTIDRDDWVKWTDAVYKYEEKPYAQVVAEIEKRLFSLPHLRIEGSAAAPVKYNDIITFTYRGEKKYFLPTNVSWNPDENESSLTLIEGVYAGNSLGNIPPFVDAGPDIYIGESETSAQITKAIADDPDGYIQSINWTILSGSGTFSDSTALNPLIYNISGDVTEAKIEVKDNLGASASDTVKIFKIGSYLLKMEMIHSETNEPEDYSLGGQIHRKAIYRLTVDPALPADETITFKFDAEISHTTGTAKFGSVVIEKFSHEIYRFDSVFETGSGEFTDRSIYNNMNYIQGDVIDVILEATLFVDDLNYNPDDEVEAKIIFKEATFKNSKDVVSNLPEYRGINILLSNYYVQ